MFSIDAKSMFVFGTYLNFAHVLPVEMIRSRDDDDDEEIFWFQKEGRQNKNKSAKTFMWF